MASYNGLPSVGYEMEPEEKDQEMRIEFFLEAFRGYIAKTVDYKDLMFFEHFSPDERRKFRSLGKNADNADVTDQMVETILLMKDKPNRYSSLVRLFEKELENEKVLRILKGEKMPSDSNYQKKKIQRVMKAICDNLEVGEIIPSLFQHKLIVSREKESLLKMERNCSNFDAVMDLMLILPNRQENWYSKFILCLIESGHEFLAKKVDSDVCQKILKYKEKKKIQNSDRSLSTEDQNELFEFCEDFGERSLIPVAKKSSLQDTFRSSDETHVKDYYKGELSLDDNTQCKQIVESEETAAKQVYDTSLDFGTMEAPVLTDKQDPSLNVNNLSPYKPEEFSMMSVSGVESVKRSLNESLDMSLSFNSLLTDTENTKVQGRQINSLDSSLSGERSFGTDSSGSGSGLGSEGSFDSYLQCMEQPNSGVSNRQKSLMSNPTGDFSHVQILEAKRSFSEYQKLTTSKPIKSEDDLTAVNVDTSKYSSKGKDDLYDRTKLSQDDLKDKDENDQGPYNITEKAINEDDTDEIEDTDISLREYQRELAAPALQGKNVIIVAPTGSGKTRVAMRIIQEHIRQQKGRGIAKVIFLVNQVALANQQGEACRGLLKKYTSKVITGESQRKSECLKDFIDKRDILVVTAQVLLDALCRKEISGINKFSLIVFDECHHTHANHTFNQIMGRYMDLKYDKPDHCLPQIVGLTASVGVGKARNEEKAMEHIKHLMANLDAQVICTVQRNMGVLRQHVSLPEEETHKVPKRQNDVFQENLIKLMNTIEKRMTQSSLVKEIPEASKIEGALKAPAQKGTAQYTQWVSKLWRETAKLKSSEARRFLNPCRTHLEHYNNALIIYNDARMEDAFGYLDAEMNRWKKNAVMDENDSILYGVFQKLRSARFRNCPNPKLDKLCQMITKAYEGNFENSRGIVFVKTRDLSKAILSWMKETPFLRELNPIVFVGTNMAADIGGMTKAKQVDVLEYFRNGKHKLIIATSVAEECLDISKCNLVIRYDHVTNEIAMVQSRGRGRAADNKYYVIAEENMGMAEREELNMTQEVMMRKAIIQLQKYVQKYPDKFHQEKLKFQDEANLDRQLKSLGSRRKLIRTGQFELRCIKCDHFICWSGDVKKVQDFHHVVTDEYFAERVTFSKSGSARYQDEATGIQFVGKFICKECGGNLGVICIHRTLEFPVLKIENFLIVDTSGRVDTYKKWKSVPFHVAPLTIEEWKEIASLPEEILKMDANSVRLFKKALKDGKEEINSIRVMIVGHCGVGKTTLTKRLFREHVDIAKSMKRTNGIEVHSKRCKILLAEREWLPTETENPEEMVCNRIASLMKNISYEVKPEKEETPHQTINQENTSASETKVNDQKDITDKQPAANLRQKSRLENELVESPVRKKLDTKEAGTLHKNKDLKSPKKEIDPNRQLTDLIQDAVKRGTPEHNRNIADLSIWDFAGQYVFYATHQIFLSRRAIYLLVTDLSQHLDNPVQDDCYIDSKGRTHCNISEFVTFWLNSIHTFCESERTGEPPVILVGTFADKLPKEKREEITDEFFTKLRETLAYSEAFEHLSGTTFAIDNSILDPNVEELRKTIVDIATKQSYWTELYPARWVVLERSLENFKRQGKKILPKRTLKLASENLHLPIDNEEFELFLRFHHETGYILYFSDEKLKDHIILEPQWLADALKCFITARQFCTKKADLCKMWLDFNNTAILKRDFIDAVWSRETLFQEHQDLILNFMERLDIIARPRQALNSGNTFEDFYFAPCFSKQTAPDLLLEIDEQECKSTSRLCFTTSSRIISVQLFNKLLAECITKWPISKQNDQYLIFCGCALFSVAKLHELYIYLRDSVIQIWIYKYSKKEPEPDSVVCSNVKDFITDSLNNGIRGSTELEMFVICQESPFKTTENMLKVDDLLREEEYKCNSHERRHVVSTSTLLKCWFPKHFEYQADHSDAFLNRSPTEKELSRLAQRIGREYRSLGFELGLTRPQLDHIEMEERNRTPVDKITAMLSEWVKEKADVATFQELKRAMVAIGIEWNVVFEGR